MKFWPEHRFQNFTQSLVEFFAFQLLQRLLNAFLVQQEAGLNRLNCAGNKNQAVCHYNHNRQQLLVPRCRLDMYGRRTFFIAGPTVWNPLPDELRDPTRGSDSFKQFLKAILFSLY